jgi:hypothetical protein
VLLGCWILLDDQNAKPSYLPKQYDPRCVRNNTNFAATSQRMLISRPILTMKFRNEYMVKQIMMEVTLLLALSQVPSCISSQTSVHHGSPRTNNICLRDFSQHTRCTASIPMDSSTKLVRLVKKRYNLKSISKAYWNAQSEAKAQASKNNSSHSSRKTSRCGSLL